MIYVVFLSSITLAVQHTGVHLILQQLLGSLEDDMLLFSKTMTIDHLETARKENTNFLPSQVKSLQNKGGVSRHSPVCHPRVVTA